VADPTIQRAILKGVLSLPQPVLRLASGGSVVYRGGRTLDPRFQFLAHRAKSLTPLTRLTPSEARRAAAEALGAVGGRPEPGVATESIAIGAPTGTIDARAYRPAAQDPAAPLLVWAHM